MPEEVRKSKAECRKKSEWRRADLGQWWLPAVVIVLALMGLVIVGKVFRGKFGSGRETVATVLKGAALKVEIAGIRLVVEGDESLDCGFWLQLVGEIVKHPGLVAIDQVDLLCGAGASSRCLTLYQPRIGEYFPDQGPD